jgi:hypothetical protein
MKPKATSKTKPNRARREPAFGRWRLLCQGPGERRLSIRTLPKSASEKDFEKRYPEHVDRGEQWLKDPPQFDELVIHNMGVHLERLDTNTLWMEIGPAQFVLCREKRTGELRLRMQEGAYDPADQLFHEHGWQPKGGRK